MVFWNLGTPTTPVIPSPSDFPCIAMRRYFASPWVEAGIGCQKHLIPRFGFPFGTWLFWLIQQRRCLNIVWHIQRHSSVLSLTFFCPWLSKFGPAVVSLRLGASRVSEWDPPQASRRCRRTRPRPHMQGLQGARWARWARACRAERQE